MRVIDCPRCVGCPLYGDGSQQFVPDVTKPGAPVYLLADQPGDRGPVERSKRYIELSGLKPEQVSSGHAIRCTADLPPPVTAQQFEKGQRGVRENAVRFCDRVHHSQASDVRLVVTQGDVALYAATGQRSAHEWRGWLLPYQAKSDGWLSEVWVPVPNQKIVLSTVSLGDIAVMPTLQFAMRADWRKVGRVLRGEWPQALPGFETQPPKVWPRLSAFDTEFDPSGALERYSLFDGQTLRVVEARSVRAIDIPEPVTVIMHNEDADIEHLRGFLRGARIKTEDSMLAHAALYSDLPHSLAYLGSLYARTNRWKHLFHRAPLPYSAGDALGTWDVWFGGLIPEFQKDPASARVYREELYPLNAIISEASAVGLKLDQDRVQVALRHHQALKDEVCLEAQAYCGYPLLLSSADQVQRHLYGLEGVGAKQKRGKRALR